MPRGRGIYDDESADETKRARPDQSEDGRESGTPKREDAPDVSDTSGEPTA